MDGYVCIDTDPGDPHCRAAPFPCWPWCSEEEMAELSKVQEANTTVTASMASDVTSTASVVVG